MMKIKVAYGNDMRLFKYDGASLSEAYDALTTFVLKTFGIEGCRLQYEDDENDLITVTSEDELDEAFDFAMEQGRTLKLFVVAAAAQPTAPVSLATEEKAEIPPQDDAVPPPVEEPAAEDKPTEPSEPTDCHQSVRDLGRLFVEDEGFRQEFSAFAQDVVLQIREGDNFETAVRTALAGHDELAAHPFVRDHFVRMLPFIAGHAEMAVPFLKNVEPNEIPGLVEQAVEATKEGQQMMPMFMQMMAQHGCPGATGTAGAFPFGPMCSPHGVPGMGPFGMPLFGGGCSPHGQSHAATAGGHCPPGFQRGHCHPKFRGGGGCGRGRGRRGRGRGCGRRGRHNGKNKAYRADIVDAEVTLGDKAVVLPNSSVIKTWLIRNTGEEAFPEGTQLKYVGRPFNELVDGVEFPVEQLASGEEGQVSILLSTPSSAGRFGSAWRLQLPDGTPFGPLFRARVVVVNEDEIKFSDSDDMSDIYDTSSARKPKAKKLEKLLAQRAKLEARLAKLGAKIEATQSRLEASGVSDNDEVAPVDVPVVEPSAPEVEEEFEVVDATEESEAGEFAFANELEELRAMGFDDPALNRVLLKQFNGQLNPVLNALCEMRA